MMVAAFLTSARALCNSRVQKISLPTITAPKQAMIAVGHAILVAIYHMLKCRLIPDS